MFITFEGLDFSGKTTQAELLVERLKSTHVHDGTIVTGRQAASTDARTIVHFLREPGGTRISERIREVLLDNKWLEMTEAAEIFLFSASRTQLVSEVILPALKRGEIVVCDRFFDSTTAYQGYGRGLDLASVETINRMATLGVKPDLTLVIDIPVAEIERRKLIAGVTFDRMEESGKDFYERVRAGYGEIARRESGRCVIVNGIGSIEDVHRKVLLAVERKFSKSISRTSV